ncbi:MAG: carboxypeptidase regulatory-like domain-containing protein, partial [Planctomycetes bacterium]|nr:carboxypeptidase regulatory-like domain-containing protein [Planctomycetota bacterium]
WQSGEGQDVELAEGQTKDNVTLELKRGAKVSGRVVDADTDAPIADVALYATDPVRRFSQALAETDAEGRYGFYGWPGSLELHVSKAPGNYIVPPAMVKKIEAVEAAELVVPDFRLKKGVALHGVVVDEAGRPVAGAEVTVARVTGHSYTAHSGPPTDAEGRFRLQPMDPATRLTLAGRRESAFTEPITVTAGEQKESLKLVLKTGTGAKVTGRVVDEQGKPIARAQVSARPHWESGRFMPGGHDSAVTGEEGRFETILWPSVGYNLNASAAKHKSADTGRWQTEPGKVRDVGDIVLYRLAGVLAGRVVDSKGLPVQGAKVWNSGDAEKRLEATTDAEGRFRLEGFEAGFAYVFAEKEGSRLSGQRSACPAEGLILILRRADEAVAVRKPMPAAEPDAAEMRRLALKALDIGLKQTEGQKSDSGKWRRTQLVGLLARVDPVPATELAAKEGGQDKGRFSMSDRVIVAMGRQALARSVEEAIAHFNQLADIESKAWAALDGARKLAKTSPAKAEALLAYALPAIHGVPNVPRQTVDLAIAAGLMLQLNMPRGHELLAEAAGKAKNFALTGWEAYARGVVAEQLCERDLEMAMALITPITDPIERPRHLENIAYRIAAKQPDRAKQLVDGIEQTWEREKALARLCHRLAGVDVGRAEAVAESIHERAETKARAYVWMAEQVADTDRQKAFAYLSGAVETVSQRAKATNYFDNVHSPSIVIALVARTAAKLGHPEAGAMLLQSLSLRPLPRALGASGHGEADARLAIALAAADATTAREFLEVLMPRTLALVRQRPKAGEIYRAGGIVADVALAALITAPSLFERYLEDVQKANGPVDAKRLAEYALGDAKEREDVVRQALHIPKPDEDW